MILKIHFDCKEEIEINDHRLKEIASQIIEKEGYRIGEIEIIITSDQIIKKLNKDFLGKNNLTDIIAFNNNKKDKVRGELYISRERVASNSKRFSGGNFKLELYRVIIHGFLHLVGYNDLTANEKAQMSELEDYYLNELNLRISKGL